MASVTVQVPGLGLQKVATYTVQVPTLMVGATLRGTGSGDSVVQPRPVWDVVRTYNNSDALNVPAGSIPATSYGSILNNGWNTSTTTKNTLRTQLAALPDKPGVRVADTHEFDNPSKYGTDVTTYLADAAAFKAAVVQVNTGRTNPLIIFRCCMAYSLSQPSRNIDAFYTQDPQNYDEFGPDVYKIADISLVVSKAQQYGKPLCIPEFGPLTNVDHVDSAILDEIQRGIAAWTAPGVNATWACWFDKKGSGADFDAVAGDHAAYTQALAYWKAQL